jgi:hypothetical protein
VSRSYQPVHNIGHFRYLEASHRSEDGRPSGEITLWEEIHFPFDPALRAKRKLDSVEVGWCEDARGEQITETYTCDQGGSVTVTIANTTSGYQRDYRLGRWSVPDEPLRPGKRRKRKSR